MTRIHIPLAFKDIFRSGKEAHSLGLVALGTLLGLMPSGSTNKTSSLPTVSVISAASIAARGSNVGPAIRIVALHVVVVVIPLPAPVVAAAPTTSCPTALDC